MDITRRRVDQADWREVAEEVREEEQRVKEEEQKHWTNETPIPYLDSIQEGTQYHALTEKAVRFYIVGHGERNNAIPTWKS